MVMEIYPSVEESYKLARLIALTTLHSSPTVN